MSEWEDAILDAVASAGGEADLSHIYSTLQGTMQLTKQHLRATQWGGRPAYQHQVRSHITNLCQAGALRWVSRGRYALTPGGRTRVRRG